jgi:undecaprenyl phosphate N,N'-diacetylbacillosamine 1-phosphate transferase
MDANNSNFPTDQLSNKKSIYSRFFKRPMDFILSLGAIIVLAPVLLILAILVRVKLGSPVLFKQKRPGLNDKIFTLYKFRTMTDERDENGELLSDSDRLTKFGKFLRSTSLDELPELFNILKGDMSIVGPRPY